MKDYSIIKTLADGFNCTYIENEPLSKHTSFKIGGPTDLYIAVNDTQAMAEIYSACVKCDINTLILGNGSNLLVTDKGFRGVVLSTVNCLVEAKYDGAYIIECDAGVKLSRVCTLAYENGLTGLEFAWGIPGSVGGAVYMNAGAYDGEIKDVLYSVEHITPSGEIVEVRADDINLGYRMSDYQKNNCVITKVKFKLSSGIQSEIKAKMDDFMQRRKDKQPLEFASAGSTFKRPSGYFAGKLIDECGLRGYSFGDACVSQKHCGFVINKGKATFFDVMKVIEHVKQEVFLQKNVKLECEVRIVGE